MSDENQSVPPESFQPVDSRDISARFASALVEGDFEAASAIVDALLAERARWPAGAPLRPTFPVSVASARVGRALALAWCVSPSRERARVGAFCLWLIRAEEGDAAPESDRQALLAASSAAERTGPDDERLRTEVLSIAFDVDAR